MNLFINVFFSNAESKMSSILVASKLWHEVSWSSMPRRFNEINLFPTSPTLYNSYNIIQTFLDFIQLKGLSLYSRNLYLINIVETFKFLF